MYGSSAAGQRSPVLALLGHALGVVLLVDHGQPVADEVAPGPCADLGLGDLQEHGQVVGRLRLPCTWAHKPQAQAGPHALSVGAMTTLMSTSVSWSGQGGCRPQLCIMGKAGVNRHGSSATKQARAASAIQELYSM